MVVSTGFISNLLSHDSQNLFSVQDFFVSCNFLHNFKLFCFSVIFSEVSILVPFTYFLLYSEISRNIFRLTEIIHMATVSFMPLCLQFTRPSLSYVDMTAFLCHNLQPYKVIHGNMVTRPSVWHVHRFFN